MTEARALTGSLEALSLPGLLQVLSAEGRTGRLDVASGARSGSFWLVGGGPVHAVAARGSERVQGQAALDLLLGLVEGSFTFVPEEAAPDTTLDGSIDRLLMEAAVRRDHGRRDGAAVSPESIPSFAPVPSSGASPRFTTLQWRVLAAIDGRKTVQGIATEVELPVAALCVLLSELESSGVIRIT